MKIYKNISLPSGKLQKVHTDEYIVSLSLPGIPGIKGDKGDIGLQGLQGEQGIQGERGDDASLGGIILGTSDAYGRTQIWNKLTNSILRLGALQQDGDPEPNVSSEGFVCYGKNLQNDIMYQSNWSYVRLKPNRIGLYNSKLNGYVGYIVKFDTTEDEWYFTDNSGNKKIKFYRSSGKLLLTSLTNGITEVLVNDIIDAVNKRHTDIIFISVTLLDNQVTPQLLFSYPVSNRFSFFLFSVERNNNFKQIYKQMVTDGITVSGGNNQNTAPSPDGTGITLSQAVVGTNVEVYYTSTNTGFNGIFKYTKLTQWS